MARDGTARGHGAKPKAGRPAKPLKEKIENGNPGHRPLQRVELPSYKDLTPINAEELEVPEMPVAEGNLEVEEAPQPRDYMEDPQHKVNGDLRAKHIYQETMEWLDKTGCKDLIEREVVDLYVMSAARWVQMERALSKFGALTPHPTTHLPISSPYAALSDKYSKTMMNCWYTIYQIVKENCVGDYKTGSPQDSVMDMLLSE